MFDGSQHKKSLQRQQHHTLLIWCHSASVTTTTTAYFTYMMPFRDWLPTLCGFMTSVLFRRHDSTQWLHTCNTWPHLSNAMASSKQSRDHVHHLKQDRIQSCSMFDGSQHNKSLQWQRHHTLLIWCHSVSDWKHDVASWRLYCLDVMIQLNGYTRATHDLI